MKILVTAGNTQAPIDRVRCITNIFTGRTGTGIALEALRRGHHVTLLTSHPEVVEAMKEDATLSAGRWQLHSYRTFDDLRDHLEKAVRTCSPDAVLHSAAVSDYRSAGIYSPAPGTRFRESDACWQSDSSSPPALIDRAANKVKSEHEELWLRLARTPKLIDMLRSPWGFAGMLVKFKLEVGVREEELLSIAERSRGQSSADLIVANTLEGSAHWAYLGPIDGRYVRLSRRELPGRLLDQVERLHQERHHG